MARDGTLVVDVGGNNVKIMVSGHGERRKLPSGPDFTPADMVAAVRELAAGLDFERVTIGVPFPVRRDKPVLEPHNLGPGWTNFDFAHAFDRPTKLVNDAVMQAVGSYDGGTMLFLGLGTGLGAALVADGTPIPLELAHMPYMDGMTYEDCVGRRGYDRLGRRKWEATVAEVCEILRRGMVADYVVLGGGNAKRLKDMPPDCRLGDNMNAFYGGFRLWEDMADW